LILDESRIKITELLTDGTLNTASDSDHEIIARKRWCICCICTHFTMLGVSAIWR